jgi:hypothetical protein
MTPAAPVGPAPSASTTPERLGQARHMDAKRRRRAVPRWMALTGGPALPRRATRRIAALFLAREPVNRGGTVEDGRAFIIEAPARREDATAECAPFDAGSTTEDVPDVGSRRCAITLATTRAAIRV